MSSVTDQAKSPPENTASPAESKSRKRPTPGDDWLPPGWTSEDKVRTSGIKAGRVDKIYYEPVTGRKFRSKNEVLYYLEHGTLKRSGKKPEIKQVQSQQSEGLGSSRRQTKPKEKANEKPPPKPLNFDFVNVPEKVVWTGTNGSEESWWPFIGDYKIQASISQDWDKAFTFLTAPNNYVLDD